MKNSLKVALCGVITALSVALLFLGGTMFIFMYIMPIVASTFMIMLKRSFSNSSAVITYASTSLLSLMLLPDKECALMYAFFFGYYPIILNSLEKIKIKPLKLLVKLLIFNFTILSAELVLVYIFNIPFLDEGEGRAFIIIFAVLMNFLFLAYDFAVKSFTVFYIRKLEKRVKKYFK